MNIIARAENNFVSNSVVSAYRELIIYAATGALAGEDLANCTELPAYADIYFQIGGVYYFYKTLQSFTINKNASNVNTYKFSIQDCAQEYLSSFIALDANDPNVIQTNIGIVPTGYTQPNNFIQPSLTKCIVNFRGSSISGGILTPGMGATSPAYPIQGTATSLPTNGGYDVQSIEFYILNATIPPDQQEATSSLYINLFNPNFNYIFGSTQISGALTYTLETASNVFPLSNLPTNFDSGVQLSKCKTNYINGYDKIPVIVTNAATYTGLKLYILIYDQGVTAYGAFIISGAFSLAQYSTWYLPSGLKQLKVLMGSTEYNHLINPANNCYYRICLGYQVFTVNHFVFFGQLTKVGQKLPELTNLLFQNFYGHFESITFSRSTQDIDIKSSDQFIPYDRDFLLNESVYLPGHKRMNIRGSDEYILTGVFDESQMNWVKEMFLSPMLLMQVDFPDLSSTFAPVSVKDGKYKIIETIANNRTAYKVTFTIKSTQDYLQLRN